MLISSLHCHGASTRNTTLDDLSHFTHPQERLHTSQFEMLGKLRDLIFVIHLVLDDELCFILRGTNSAPLPCGSCAPSFVSLGSCTSLGSVLFFFADMRLNTTTRKCSDNSHQNRRVWRFTTGNWPSRAPLRGVAECPHRRLMLQGVPTKCSRTPARQYTTTKNPTSNATPALLFAKAAWTHPSLSPGPANSRTFVSRVPTCHRLQLP